MNESLVYTQTRYVRTGSGKVHEQIKIKGSWRVDERCNLDDANVAILDDITDQIDLCDYCFPPATE